MQNSLGAILESPETAYNLKSDWTGTKGFFEVFVPTYLPLFSDQQQGKMPKKAPIEIGVSTYSFFKGGSWVQFGY